MNEHLLRKWILLVTTGIVILMSCTNSQNKVPNRCSDNYDEDWQTIRVDSANFQIDFPNCELKHWSELVIYSNKEVVQIFIDLNLQNQESNCLGYGFSYHPIEIPSEQMDELLHQEGKLNETGMSAHIEIEKKLNNWKNSREFIYNIPNGLILRQRMVIANNRIYKWSVITTRDNRFSKSVTKYLKSFKMLNTK